MKADLDRLMQERGFDAIVVMGESRENHALNYLTRHAKITQGFVIKKRGEPAVLLCGSMERDEAAKSGLAVKTFADFGLPLLIKETGSLFEAQLRMLAAALKHYGIGGTVGFYGLGDPGQSFVMLTRLGEMLPAVTVAGETETTIFDAAYTTKDAEEMEAIKSVAARTNTVMAEVVDFLKGCPVRDGRLFGHNGVPLTVGDVKRYLRARLFHYQLEDNGETIFAIGRDAGVPHSRGEDGDVLELGKSIVFDLFPRDTESGYYHDMTRTFCLGYAPPEVQRAYDEVMRTFETVMGALKVGEQAAYYQDLTCDAFEGLGHKTPRSHPGTEEGYVHSVGHGIGLQIHARPRLGVASQDVIEPGQVFTVEPGLYYPERGFGVRVEDTVYVDADGVVHSLTPFPKDLVIPIA